MHTMQKGQDEEYFEEKEISKIVFDKEQKSEKRISKQSEKNNSALDWEVDLHLEELVDNIRGMNNGQMIDVQLRHFQKKLDEGFAQNIRKIVFIHGVGNGRLKQEIRKILATHKELRFHDASYGTYGFGATEVVFK
jgi:dsDNA-specific endonuclease/ATPase MutS2